MTTAWIFPGQGSQVVGMGRHLYEQMPEARAVFDEADQTLGFGLSELCFEGPEERLTATEYAQPALLTVSTALVRAIRVIGGERLLEPTMVAGHSLGEYSALVAGGALDFATAIRLVRRRGELMAAASEGAMAAVIGLNEDTLEQICRETSDQLQRAGEHSSTVVVANYNAPDQLVISGSTHAISLAGQRAKSAGAKRVLPLKVSAAFHSPLMINAAEGMAREIDTVTVHDPSPPLLANVTAEPLHRAEDIRRELVSQIVAPVRWIASVQRMVADGIATVVEIGPGKVLTGLIRRIAPQVRMVNVSGIDDVHSYLAENR
ncbi:MAG: ACP S-malonyltransferase [Oscillochloris sp.]|nr:ACP S-malonyltransferase [Oscillochloris sp.]